MSKNFLYLTRLGIDTHQEPILYMREDCHVCVAESCPRTVAKAATCDEMGSGHHPWEASNERVVGVRAEKAKRTGSSYATVATV